MKTVRQQVDTSRVSIKHFMCILKSTALEIIWKWNKKTEKKQKKNPLIKKKNEIVNCVFCLFWKELCKIFDRNGFAEKTLT